MVTETASKNSSAIRRALLPVQIHFPIDHVRLLATLAQAALLKKFGKSDVYDFLAEIDFRLKLEGMEAVEETGTNRPWKSQERFPLSHSFNNNKFDDRDHFQQNAKTSVASLRGLIGSSRNTNRHHSGMLIDFIGIPILRFQLRVLAHSEHL